MTDAPWKDYGSPPPAAGPWSAYSPSPPEGEGREGGLMQTVPQAAAMLATPEGRGALWQGVKKLPGEMFQGILDTVAAPSKAMQGQLTPEQEIAAGFNIATMTIGARTFIAPKGAAAAVAPVAKAFTDEVVAPAAVRLDSYARTGDPNGVRLAPPAPEVKPAPIGPVQGSPFAGIPRSVAAKTGIPEVDAVLNSPVTKAVIDNPVVDRSHDVPYMAGASEKLNDPTVFIDKHVPAEQTIGGITFDPADAWVVHENVEHHVMDILTRNGMDDGEAYRVAHFEFAEPAEQAWYRAHGIDQVAAEAEQQTWLRRIQPEETAGDVPESLYQKPYPHDHVPNIDHEPVTETPPTPEEKAKAFDIIRNAPELQPKSALPMLQQARELGVVGPDDRPSLNEMPPKEAGRAVAATQASDKISGPAPKEQTAWRARWEQTLDKMATKDDVRQVLGGILDDNEEFVAARQGDMRPSEIEGIADVTGLDPTKIDVAGTSAKIKSNVELTRFTEAFRIVNDKIQQAAHDFAARRGIDDQAEAQEFTRLQLQRQLLLDSTVATRGLVALRAEWGRAGNTLRDFYRAQREAEGAPANLTNIDDLREQARIVAETPARSLPRVLILSPYKPMPWYFWATQNLLISGPITHAGYSAVNAIEIMLDHVIAPLGQQLLNKARGAPADFGAPLEAYNAIVRSVPGAFKGAWMAFKTGQRVPLRSEWELAKRQLDNPEAAGAQVPYTSPTGPDWGIWKRAFNDEQLAKAERALGVFGRSANAQHTFFKLMGEQAGTATEAYHAAAAEGLAPSMTDLAANSSFWTRYAYHAANLSDAALTRVVDGSYEGTFMEKLGEQTRVFAELARNTPLKWIFMFTHIPMNIARAGVRYSWMAAATLPFEASRIGAALRGDLGVEAQNLALVKTSIGTAVGTYFIHKALSGQSTGDYPTDEKERTRWKLLGIQPNSIQLDGQWHSLERLGPVMGSVPRLAGNYAAIIKQYEGDQDESLMKAAWLMTLGTAKVVSDDVGFQTIRNIVDALENPKEAGKQMAYQLASYADPFTMGAQLASEHDPYMREADTILRGIMMRTPFVREELMPKRDPLYGEPLPNPGFHAAPFRAAPINTDPVKSEMDRLQYYPTAPERTIGHVKLNDEQYDRYEATAGPLVKQMLAAAVASPHYAQMPDVGRQEMLKGIISAGRAQARVALQFDAPHLIQQGIANRTSQITGASP
jgi:hypothetical protein